MIIHPTLDVETRILQLLKERERLYNFVVESQKTAPQSYLYYCEGKSQQERRTIMDACRYGGKMFKLYVEDCHLADSTVYIPKIGNVGIAPTGIEALLCNCYIRLIKPNWHLHLSNMR